MHFKSFFVLILMISAYSSWKSKIQYLKILEYFLRSIKKGFAKQKSLSSLKYVHLCTQYLVRAPLAQMTASVRCGMEAISLWHCWGTIEHSARLYCWIDCFLSFLLKRSHRFHMGFRSGMLAGQSSTVISWSANHLEVVLALWAGAKVLLEKEISISIKLVSRWKHKVIQNLLVDSCIDFGLDKAQWTNTSRRHGTPNHHWLLETSHWISSSLDSVPLQSSSRLQTLISKWNAKFSFIWKEDFGPLSNSPVLFLFSPGKMLLTLSLVQKWLGSPFPEDVWAWWLLMHWLQLQSTPCEALPSVWIGFAWQVSWPNSLHWPLSIMAS